MARHPLLTRRSPGDGRQVSPALVGRDDLVALAARRWAAARAGQGHLLLLAGEAGIGKTRLLAEIVAAVDGPVFVAAAHPGDAEVAGGLLTDLAVDLRRGSGASAALAERLADGAAGGGDAHRRRRMLAADLAGILATLATLPGSADPYADPGGGAVLVALEDLHWADELALDVLERLARQLPGVPMLVVGTYRSDELYPRAPIRDVRARLLTQRLAEEVRLPRLDLAATAALTAAVIQGIPASHLTEAVFARSDGIPLHVEEFAVALRPGEAAVPDTLADAVRARAEALGGPARDLAGAAAVIGRSFDLDLLTALVDLPPAEVDTALRELVERFFIQEHGGQEPGGQEQEYSSTFGFRHALIRDALYADLPPHRRRALHLRVATATAAAGLGDAFLSDQYERAHRPGDAHRHALRAATAAGALSAHREAVGLFRRAQRTTPGGTPGSDRADLLAGLAAALAATDDNAAAAAAYAEAVALRERHGDRAGAARLVPALVAVRHLLGTPLPERTGPLLAALPWAQDPAEVHAALAAAYMLDRRLDEAITHGRQAGSAPDVAATLGSVLVFAGRMDEGWRLLRDATTSAEADGAEDAAARGYRLLGSCASVLVEYDLATHWLRAGIGYAERTERDNDRHYMAAHLAHVRWATGDWDTAGRGAARALADGAGGVTTRITALHVLGFVALGRGEGPAQLTEALRLGERMGELQRISPALWGLAETALRDGRPGDAVDLVERAYAGSAAIRDAAYLFPHVVTGMRAHLAREDLTAARDWHRRTAELLLARGIPGTLAALWHAEGLLRLHEGQTGKARDLLERAGAEWDARHRHWEGAHVLLDRARCASRSRRPAEAAALRAEAARRLPGLSTPGPAPAPAPVLTPREQEVARLIAGGATNREISATLGVSPRTVGAHVEHILTKLGFTRRSQVAAWFIGLRADG